MGQTLSSPITEKHTTDGMDENYSYGASCMQGWRISMEDAHTTILKLENNEEIAFFAVFDGHGGSNVAIYAGKHLHNRIMKSEFFKNGDYPAALKEGFLGCDLDLRNDPEYAQEVSGCTAVCSIITKDKIYVGNAGDSRAILSIKGVVKELSFDHKPQNPEESARITKAGGFVEAGRVNGNLALSRAIGDFEFKRNSRLSAEEQVVTSNPEVTVHDITPDDEFIVIACDGIWDRLSSQEVIDFVRNAIANKLELNEISELLMEKCLAPDCDFGGIGCDNMTVVIVGLFNGKTKEEWYADTIKKCDNIQPVNVKPRNAVPTVEEILEAKDEENSGFEDCEETIEN